MAFLSLNKTHIAAGETFRLTFTDRDGNSGDTVSYTISGTGITADHFDGETSLSGTVTLGANGIGFKDFDTTADFPTGDEFVSVAFASTGYNGIALKVYSSFHYTTDEKIEQTDTFNDWRKKSNGLFARVDALEESKVNFRSDTIIADGVNSEYTLNFDAASSDTALYDVNIDGITQNPLDAYTIDVDAGSIVFNEVPPVNASISVVFKYEIGSIAYTTTEDGSITSQKLAFGAVTETKIDDGVVVPSKLSTGGPSWDSSGNLTVTGEIVSTQIDTIEHGLGSIAELKLYDDLEDNRTVFVRGYYSSGDGGGGTFFWDAASTDADNGGTIIQATGVTTGRWKRVYNDGVLNVKWFGAIEGDDTLGAFNYTVFRGVLEFSLGGGTSTANFSENPSIYIPLGTWYIKGQSVFGLTVEEMIALTGYRYRRGLKIYGESTEVTTLVLQNVGGEHTWFYNNDNGTSDADGTNDSSTLDYLRVQDITFSSYAGLTPPLCTVVGVP